MRVRRTLWLILLPLAAVAPAAAQGDESPAGVLRAAYDALERREWLAAARWVDARALEEFRKEQLTFLGREPFDRIEAMRRHDPSIPECVLDHWRREDERNRARFNPTVEMFGTADVEALRRLPPDELLARSLQARDPRERMRREVVRQMPKARQKVEEADTLLWERRTILGQVMDGDSLAHVAYRARLHPDGPAMVRMATLRRTPRGWRIASADLLAHSDVSFVAFAPAAAKPREKEGETHP